MYTDVISGRLFSIFLFLLDGTYCHIWSRRLQRRSFVRSFALRQRSEQRDFVADASSNDARRGVVLCRLKVGQSSIGSWICLHDMDDVYRFFTDIVEIAETIHMITKSDSYMISHKSTCIRANLFSVSIHAGMACKNKPCWFGHVIPQCFFSYLTLVFKKCSWIFKRCSKDVHLQQSHI